MGRVKHEKTDWPARCLRCGSANLKRGPKSYWRCSDCQLDGGCKETDE